ncbi:MAG TPA: winged helix DNA-binding domain-containing protein [Gaiellaceae bacterium]|nr:winged helix DNA-binding domain-containing protein [Gaiellaceae bacterium]
MTPRELRLATLARQLLLERVELTAVEALERLSGLQAQDSTGPYLGLWARLDGFERGELTAAVESREVVVATLQRVTMHMVSAADHAWLKPTLAPVHEQTRRRPVIRDLDQERLLAEARRRAPVRMRDLHDLAPGVNTGHLNDFFQASLPFVRVPPAGTWGVSGSPVQELAEVGEPDVDRLVRSYLGAFGPATVADAQAWSGLKGLRAVFERLELEELGDGLYDLPGAPHPPGTTRPPVRFLPRYDNLFLGYADRSRFGAPPIGVPTVLVDGLPAARWEWRDGDVHVTPDLGAGVEEERRRLVRFLT